MVKVIKKFKSFFIITFIVMFLIEFHVDERNKVKAIVPFLLLAPAAVELLCDITAGIMASAILASAVNDTYKIVTGINRQQAVDRVKASVSNMTQAEIDTMNSIAQEYQSGGATYNLDMSKVPAPVLQDLGYSMKSASDANSYTDYSSTSTNDFYLPIANRMKTLTTNALSYFKTNYKNISFSVVYSSTKSAIDGWTNYPHVGTTNIAGFRTKAIFTFTNNTTGKTFSCTNYTMSVNNPTYNEFKEFTSYDGTDSSFIYNDYTNQSYLAQLVPQLANVFGYNLSMTELKNIFNIYGDGSICYYPPIVQAGATSISVPATLPLQGYNNTKDLQVIPLPAVSANTATKAIPVDQVADHTVPNTGTNTGSGDATGFWSMLWNWLQKLLDAIKSIPGLFLNGLETLLTKLFVPSDTFFVDGFNSLRSDFNSKFPGANLDKLSDLNGASWQFSDYKVTLMGKEATVISAKYVNDFLPTLKNWVSGFMGFLLVVYNYSQVYFLVRRTYPIVTSSSVTVVGGGNDK